MPIEGMNHFTVLAKDLAATRHFYVDVLGLEEGPRPDLGFPGVWLYVGKQAVLHVIAGRPMPADPKGVLDHMAFTATDLASVVTRLRTHGINYDLRRQNQSGTWQLFCFDPSGARVELDFSAEEAAPAP